MKEQIQHALQFFPFIGMMMRNDTHGMPPLATRLIEAALIGGVVMYGTVSVLGERIDNLQRQVEKLDHRIESIRDDVYRPRFKDSYNAIIQRKQ